VVIAPVSVYTAHMNTARMNSGLKLEPMSVPLREDASGVWRIGKTRVTFETIWRAWNEGAGAEQIAIRFSSLELADVHVVLAFALRHAVLVDAYMVRVQLEERAGLDSLENSRPKKRLMIR
jgi:uncharacterized protein (DUF433 family)